jgi:hypothetical protein
MKASRMVASLVSAGFYHEGNYGKLKGQLAM